MKCCTQAADPEEGRAASASSPLRLHEAGTLGGHARRCGRRPRKRGGLQGQPRPRYCHASGSWPAEPAPTPARHQDTATSLLSRRHVGSVAKATSCLGLQLVTIFSVDWGSAKAKPQRLCPLVVAMPMTQPVTESLKPLVALVGKESGIVYYGSKRLNCSVSAMRLLTAAPDAQTA